ncbi:EamA family transporter [Bordetella trematum]|uniref:EamA family transporter n=1 Tax=Bordetella trematum TaxID=123899 RepID=UPI000D909733|nr:EamA/RhaT family transporter [Bordetella trematum]SPU54228.1 membrane protein [Bordetella trematum]VDH08243.1 EamA-like transporter family [Bordetella trematum]
MNPGLLYLPLSVACSVAMVVMLKLARRHGLDVRQAILVNYAVASTLCLLLLGARPALPATPALWLVLLALGVLLPGGFMALAQSVRHAGIVRTDAAQRLSLFVALAAAFLFFGETWNLHKLAGTALAGGALYCLLRKPADDLPDGEHARWLWPLAVWGVYGVIDILFKVMARAGAAFAPALLGVFLLAGLLMLAWLLWRGTAWRMRDLAAGLLLGAINFGNIYSYIRAHQSLPEQPALVFASMNMGVIVLGTAVGALGFGERLSALNVAGVAMALGAIAVMLP